MRWLARPFMLAALLAALLLPLWAASALAGDDPPVTECPDGLVYYAPDDICLLPENIPAGEGEAPAKDPPAEEPPAEEPPAEEPLAEETEGEEQVQAPPSGAAPPVEDPPVGPALAGEGIPAGEIDTITVLSFVCPQSWDPATRPIADSREICGESPSLPAVSYAISFDGTDRIESGVGTDTDLGTTRASGAALPAGLWTIRQNTDEAGIADPFAFCAIYDAAGTSRFTVQETVIGGALDMLLAEGEKVNCEWYMVRAAAEMDPDDDTLPMGGFLIVPRTCPYGYGDDRPLVELLMDLRVVCAPVQDGAVTLVVSRIGGDDVITRQLLGNQDLAADRDSRLFSGTWRIEWDLTDTYSTVYLFCGLTNEDGSIPEVQPEPETFIGFIDVDVLPGQSVICEAFLVEAVPDDGATLGMNIEVFQCPEFYQEDVGIVGECPAGASVPVTMEAGRLENGVAGPPVYSVPVLPGTASVRIAADGSMRSGPWYVRVVQPTGSIAPSPYCSNATNADGSIVWEIDKLPPPDTDSLAALIGPDHLLNCEFYLFAGSTTTSVTVATRDCPANLDPAVALDRLDECTPSGFWTVSVSVDGGEPTTAEVQRNGQVSLPTRAGSWRMSIPPDAALEREVAFVTCDQTFAALGTGATIEPTLNSDRSFTMEVGEGDGMLCAVYMRNVDATSATAVPTPTPEVETDPTPTPTPAPEAATPTPTPTSESAAPNPTSTPAPPTGQTTTPPTSGTFGGGGAASSAGSSSTGDASEVEPLGELSIRPWDCPDPFPDDVTTATLMESCTASSQPSSWQLNGAPVEAPNGYAVFPDLPPGVVTVRNLAVDDTEASWVTCSFALPGAAPIASAVLPSEAGEVEVTFDASAAIACDWFVAPSPPEEGASALDRRSE